MKAGGPQSLPKPRVCVTREGRRSEFKSSPNSPAGKAMASHQERSWCRAARHQRVALEHTHLCRPGNSSPRELLWGSPEEPSPARTECQGPAAASTGHGSASAPQARSKRAQSPRAGNKGAVGLLLPWGSGTLSHPCMLLADVVPCCGRTCAPLLLLRGHSLLNRAASCSQAWASEVGGAGCCTSLLGTHLIRSGPSRIISFFIGNLNHICQIPSSLAPKRNLIIRVPVLLRSQVPSAFRRGDRPGLSVMCTPESRTHGN